MTRETARHFREPVLARPILARRGKRLRTGLIAGVFSQLVGEGGVQRLGRHSACAMASFAQSSGVDFAFLGLIDPLGYHQVAVGESSVEGWGSGGSKPAFVLRLLKLIPYLDFVHFGHPNLAPLLVMVKALRPGLRCSIQAYGFEVWEKRESLVRLGLRLAHAVIACSQHTARFLTIKQGIRPDRLRVLAPALEPCLGQNLSSNKSEQVWARSEASGRRRVRMLTVSRLDEPQKGIETVIAAIPRILPRYPDLIYMVVGRGPDQRRLETLADTLGVTAHVVFAGRLEDDELAAVYHGCDVFVMPSRDEGFGIVFLEAMAAGKPVVGARAGATPDVVIDGQTGLLVEYADKEGLARQLISLLSDPELCRRLGCEGRRLVESKYTFEHYIQQFCQMLTDVRGLGS